MKILPASILIFLLTAPTAFAQIDLQGIWGPRYHEDQEDRIPGTYMGDYVGMPITDEGRMRGEAWSSSRLTMPEQQCRVHVSPYIYRGPIELRIWEERDPESQKLIAIKQWIQNYQQLRTIWMDGRPHPSPNAAHTWMGFSTGRFEGNALVVTTTHIKTGWIRRNGLVQSDLATMTEWFIRHGDHLTHTRILDDVYISEPLIHTTDFVLDPYYRGNWIYPCEPVEEISTRAKGDVPHFLPGKNPFLDETVAKLRLPAEAVRGGANTIYPEYKLKLKGIAVPARPASAMMTRPADVSSDDIEILPVQGAVYMLAGAGGNMAVQVGKQGTVLADTKIAASSGKVLAALSKLTDTKIRYIINTSVDPDHTGGNKILREAGITITGANVTRDIADAAVGAGLIAHENVMNRMVEAKGPQAIPANMWPTSTYANDRKELFFNGEPIEVIHIPNAHTDGDSIVHFRRSDVVITGDIYVPNAYPVIDIAKGGNVQGIIDGLNRILDILIPDYGEEGGTMVIPGHGRISDEADVVEYRDMVTIVRDRVREMINRRMTLDQVRAARPTRDYDPVYGPGDVFLEAVFRSLTEKTK